MSLPEKDKEPTVQLVIDDLRRLFDEVSSNYTSLKSRALGILAGEVALISFIFSGNGINIFELTTAEKIFFGFGATALIISFGLLLWIVATRGWLVPLDLKDSKKLYKRFNGKLDWLEDIKEDYEHCIEYILDVVRKRSSAFNKTLILLSFGIIIMLVLKFTTQQGG